MLKKLFAIAMMFFAFLQLVQAGSLSIKSFKSAKDTLHIFTLNLDSKRQFKNWGIILSPQLRLASKQDYFQMFELQEAIMSYSHNSLELGLGKKIFSWGQTLEINPVDIVNPRDFTDLLDWERIGVKCFFAKLYLGDRGLLEGISSFFQPARLATHPLPIGIMIREQILPSKNNLHYSGRLSLSLYSFDLSLIGHYGYNPFPLHYKRYVSGLSLSRNIVRDLILRTEIAYFVPEAKAQDDSYIQAVVGMDRFWPNLIRQSNLYVLVQYAREAVIKKGGNPRPDDLARIFKNHFGGETSLDINSNWQIKLKGIYNLDYKDYFSEICLQWQVIDKLKFEFAVDVFGGPKKSFFGQYNSNNRIKLSAQYLF